jgi:hypothetical protein
VQLVRVDFSITHREEVPSTVWLGSPQALNTKKKLIANQVVFLNKIITTP